MMMVLKQNPWTRTLWTAMTKLPEFTRHGAPS